MYDEMGPLGDPGRDLLYARSDRVRPVSLTSEGLSDLWTAPIGVPSGCWLARGDVTRAKSLAASLLTFFPKPDLREGDMEVLPDTSGGDLHFNVYVSEQLFPQCRVRTDLQIAALIAAFGRIPHLDPVDVPDSGEDTTEYGMLTRIKERLREANVTVWGEGLNEHFDPARAATAIEQFRIEDPALDPVDGDQS